MLLRLLAEPVPAKSQQVFLGVVRMVGSAAAAAAAAKLERIEEELVWTDPVPMSNLGFVALVAAAAA